MVRLSRRSLWLASFTGIAIGFAVGGASVASCHRVGSGGTAGDGGGGSGGGCPTGGPAPLFTLHVRALHGSVPSDTAVTVTWSAGAEPTFKLDDPTTWKTLENGTNAVCPVAPDAGVPVELAVLDCELWTAGATLVHVSAAGHLTYEETLVPKLIDTCEHPVPSEVTVTLVVDPDAGVP